MSVDWIHFTLNLILALFGLRMAQIHLINKDSDLGKALSFLLH